MARPRAEKVGRGKCLSCGYPVTYRKSTGGYLKADCEECEASGYYPPGSVSYQKAMATIAEPKEPDAKPEGNQDTQPEQQPNAAPAQKRAASVFDLGAL